MKEGWTYKKLGEVCKVTMGQSPNGNSVNDTNGIEFHQGKVFFGEKYLNVSNSFTEQPSKIAEPNSVLLCVRAPVGTVNITPRRICIGRGLCSIKPNDIIIMPFLFYALTQKQAYFDKNSTGSTFKAISSKVVINTVLPIPPLAEQERIVAELDLLSSIIDKKKAQLKELDQLAQSIFYTMFGDPITNEKGWEVKKLGEIGFCSSGGTPSRRISHYFEGTINWYSAGELNTMYLNDSIEKITQEALDNSNAKLCKEKSLFIGMYDTAAFKLGIPLKKSASNQACANVNLYEDNVMWLYYSLLLMRDEALKHRHGARQKNLSLTFIKDFSIPLPPLQQEFASKIEAIERQKSLIQQSIVETQTLFDSRMDYWFGKEN